MVLRHACQQHRGRAHMGVLSRQKRFIYDYFKGVAKMTRKELYQQQLRITKKELVILLKEYRLAYRRWERAIKKKALLEKKLGNLK
jgi:hypothetical protein